MHPPLQWITGIKILTRELEVLLNLVHECLRKVSEARCKVNPLRRGVYCRALCRSCQDLEWPRFIILDMEMGMKDLFGSIKLGTGIPIITTVCEKTTI